MANHSKHDHDSALLDFSLDPHLLPNPDTHNSGSIRKPRSVENAMIEKNIDNDQIQIIISPNKSMSWQTNKKLLLAIFVLNMSIALAWTYMGAWMVLPFAGLEVLLVGLGMYYVSWKLNFKQIITVKNESLILQKGVYFPKEEWHWRREDTTLICVPSDYRMSPPALSLQHLNQRIEVGDFLNRDEKKEFRQQLVDLGIPLITREKHKKTRNHKSTKI